MDRFWTLVALATAVSAMLISFVCLAALHSVASV